MPIKKFKTEVMQFFGDWAQLRTSVIRGIPQDPYLVLILELATGMPGSKVTTTQTLKGMRLSQIKAAINEATEKFEKKHFSQEQLEILLDYLFAELNRRLNK